MNVKIVKIIISIINYYLLLRTFYFHVMAFHAIFVLHVDLLVSNTHCKNIKLNN